MSDALHRSGSGVRGQGPGARGQGSGARGQRWSSLSITYCHPPATHRARCRCNPLRRTWRDSALSTRSLFSKYCVSWSNRCKQSLCPRRPVRSISASVPKFSRRVSILCRYGAAQASGTRSSLTIVSAARTLASTPWLKRIANRRTNLIIKYTNSPTPATHSAVQKRSASIHLLHHPDQRHSHSSFAWAPVSLPA